MPGRSRIAFLRAHSEGVICFKSRCTYAPSRQDNDHVISRSVLLGKSRPRQNVSGLFVKRIAASSYDGKPSESVHIFDGPSIDGFGHQAQDATGRGRLSVHGS
jgi:hypothetical protein